VFNSPDKQLYQAAGFQRSDKLLQSNIQSTESDNYHFRFLCEKFLRNSKHVKNSRPYMKSNEQLNIKHENSDDFISLLVKTPLNKKKTISNKNPPLQANSKVHGCPLSLEVRKMFFSKTCNRPITYLRLSSRTHTNEL